MTGERSSHPGRAGRAAAGLARGVPAAPAASGGSSGSPAPADPAKRANRPEEPLVPRPEVGEGSGPAPDFAPGLEAVFSCLPAEQTAVPLEVVGQDGRPLPDILRGLRGLRGTYYHNGPARFERGGLRYRHWLDGDGMVCALHFGGGAPELSCRFVRGAKWCAEEEAGQALFRTFGTAFSGDRLARGVALESPVNVSVYPWAGRLLAFGEQGLPYELDPRSLATLGPFTFGGGLNAVSPLAAHPKIDLERSELVAFGVSFSPRQPCLHLYRCDASGALLERRRVDLERPCSVHDFCLSASYAVFYLAPYLVDWQVLAGGGTLMDSLRWEPSAGSQILVVSRASGELLARVPAGDRYCLHTVHAWDRDGRLELDAIELERPVYDQYQVPDLFRHVPSGWPARLTIDVPRGRLLARTVLPYDRAPDFPVVDPRTWGRSATDLWLLGISAAGRPGRKFFDELVRLDWSRPGATDLWRPPTGHYLGGEPAFIPGHTPRSGSLLCHLFSAPTCRSSFLLFDAYDLAAGPVAELPLPSPIPPAFHSVFAPQ